MSAFYLPLLLMLAGLILRGVAFEFGRQGRIAWVHIRHEEAAALAAGVEAHVSGETRDDRNGPRASPRTSSAPWE
jgi:hypothetical protein